MTKSEPKVGFDAKFLQEWSIETGTLMIIRTEESRQTFLKQSLHKLLWLRLPIASLLSLFSCLLAIYIHITTIQISEYTSVGALDTLLLFHYSFLSFPLELLNDIITFYMIRRLVRDPRDVEGVHRLYSLSLFMTLYYSLVILIIGLLFKQVYIGPYLSSKYDYSFNDLIIYLTVAPFVSPFLHLTNAILERGGFYIIITIQRFLSYIATAVLLSLGYLFLLLYNTLVFTKDDSYLSVNNIVSVYFNTKVFLYPVIIAILLPDMVCLCLNVIRMFYDSYNEHYSYRSLVEMNPATISHREHHFMSKAQSKDAFGSSHPATASEKITTTSLIKENNIRASNSQEARSHIQVLRSFRKSTILTKRPYSDALYQCDIPFTLMILHGKLFPKNTKVLINVIIDLAYRWLGTFGHVGLTLFIIMFLYINVKESNLLLLNINICAVYIFVRRALFSITIPISFIFRQIYLFNSREKHYRKIAIAFYYYLFVAFVGSSLLGGIFYFLLSPRFTKFYLESGFQITDSELYENITILRFEALLSPFLSIFYMVDILLEQRQRILIGLTVKFISLIAGCVTLFYVWGLQKQFSDFSYPLLIADIVLCMCGVVLLPLVIFELQLLILETRVESRRPK